MKITAIKTPKITPEDSDLLKILDQALPQIKDNSILSIASKIISITEGSVVKVGEKDKEKIIEEQADLYLPPNLNSYNISLTITKNILIPHAGVDESNGAGYYILWPKDPQTSANQIRTYLKNKFHINNVAVIITDSKTTPLRWGTTGIAIGYSGVKPLRDYIGQEDLFGRELQYTKANVIDGLAEASVLVMGEGAEQTPIALIEDLEGVEFVDQDPTQEEIDGLRISLEDDLYSPLLKAVPWKKSS